MQNSWTAKGPINLSTNVDKNSPIEKVYGISNTYSDRINKPNALKMTIDTPNDDFSIKISNEEGSQIERVTGLAVVGKVQYDANDKLVTTPTNLTVNAQNFTLAIDSKNTANSNIIGISSEGNSYGRDISSLNINASGKISVSINANSQNDPDIYVLNSNNSGKISLKGSSIDLSSQSFSGDTGLSLSWNNAINAFYGETSLEATDANGEGIVLKSAGDKNFVATVDLQNKNQGQVQVNNSDRVTDINYNDPTALSLKSNSNILIESDTTKTTLASANIAFLGRHYSWTNGDLDLTANLKIDIEAQKDLNIIAKSGTDSLKTVGIALEASNKIPDSDEIAWQKFKGENVNISAIAENAQKNITSWHNIWGDAHVAAVSLLNGALQIEANQDISLYAQASNTDIIRAFYVDEKTEDKSSVTQDGGDYIDENNHTHTYISTGDAFAKLTAGNDIKIDAKADKATQDITAVYWGSTNQGDIQAEHDIQIASFAKTSAKAVAVNQKHGTLNIAATNDLSILASQSEGTEGNLIYGILAEGGSLNSSSINLSIQAQDIQNKATAIGIFASAKDAKDKAVINHSTLADGDILIEGADFGVLAAQNAEVNLDNSKGNNTQIIADMAAVNGGKVNLKGGKGITSTNLLAISSGEIDVSIQNGSTLVGYADNYSETAVSENFTHLENSVLNNQSLQDQGKINATLEQDSTWNLSDNSWIDSLNLNAGTVNLTYDGVNSNFHTLTTKTLNSNSADNSGNFNFRINMKTETVGTVDTDQLLINDASSGSYRANITITDADLTNPKAYSENFLIRYGDDKASPNLSAISFNSDLVRPNGATYAYRLVYVEDASQLQDKDYLANAQGSGSNGYWHLVLVDEKDPNVPGSTPEIDTIKNIGTSYGQYLAWRSDLSDLRHRLGEVRYGAQSGVWAKAIYDKERACALSGQGFKQETYGVHLGADGFVHNSEAYSWLVGASLRLAKANQSSFSYLDNGDGTLDSYTAKLYATYMSQNGSYADFVLSAGYFDQSISGRTNQNDGFVNADYDTFGAGVSVELGRMFSFDEQVDDRQWYNHYFIEPQAQLAYYFLKGQNFNTSTNMRVSQDNVNSLIGRLGIVAGKKFNYADLDSLDKRYIQLALRLGVIHEFLGEQTVTLNDRYSFDADLGGTTFYYGVEADWQFADSQRVYLNVDRETGDDYDKEIAVRFGYKYEF